MQDIIGKEIPKTEVYTNFNSVIKSEINTLEHTLSEVNSNGEVLNGNLLSLFLNNHYNNLLFKNKLKLQFCL